MLRCLLSTPRTRGGVVPSAWLRRCLAAAVVLTGLAALLSGTRAAAQDLLKFYDDPRDPEKAPLRKLRLRPNQPRQVFLFVDTKALPAKAAGIRAELIAGKVPVATAAVKLPAKGALAPIVFGMASPPKDGKPAPLPLTEVKGPLSVRLVDADDMTLDTIPIGVAHPSEYVQVVKVAFQPTGHPSGKPNVLEVTLAATENFVGPPARVELLLPPERIPALVAGRRKEGSYAGTLSPRAPVTLRAENLVFQPTGPKQGLFYVNVDGYARAFTFFLNLTGELTQAEPKVIVEAPVLRLVHPAYVTPGTKLPVIVEVDNTKAGEFCSLGMFRRLPEGEGLKDRDGEPTTFAGDRQQEMLFSPAGPEGSLVFEPKVRDWTFAFDTKDIYGKRYLAVDMLRATKEDKVEEIRVLNSKQIPADLKPDRTKIVEEVLLYLGSAEDIALDVDLPAARAGAPELVVGTPLPLRATSQDPTGVTKAVFFTGAPLADGKIPPGVVPVAGAPLKSDPRTWVAELNVPTDKRALLTVSVQMTNGAGEPAVKTIKVQLVDPKAAKAAAGPKLTTITGRVFEGSLVVPGVPVTLGDEKGVLKGATKTDLKGEYKFEKVAPGAYSVNANRTASRTRGRTLVSVPEGKELVPDIDVRLLRLP